MAREPQTRERLATGGVVSSKKRDKRRGGGGTYSNTKRGEKEAKEEESREEQMERRGREERGGGGLRYVRALVFVTPLLRPQPIHPRPRPRKEHLRRSFVQGRGRRVIIGWHGQDASILGSSSRPLVLFPSCAKCPSTVQTTANSLVPPARIIINTGMYKKPSNN